ncbi:MAG: hypothetical protein OIF38_02320, partial [Cellvibrionaceae bacterium]|nr:hypothetical protein [Cellvibrionaceae bacterium]
AGFKQVQASADEDDLKEINWLLSRHWRAAAEAQGAKPRDDGYWLLLPLMLLMLLWFRRGMVLLINQ